MRTVIKDGMIVSASETYMADVLLDGEKISGIGSNLTGDVMLDARGKYVIPGAIDVHTHLQMPSNGTTTSDDFFTGQRAAAFGGTTTHVDFAIQPHGATLHETLDLWMERARDKAVIDYGFHIAITDLHDGVLKEIAQCIEWGVSSLKFFMAYKGTLQVDDTTLFLAMQQAAAQHMLVMVHAENGDAIEILIKQAVDAGNIAPHYHALTRPRELEAEATNRAIRLAAVAGATLYVVHVTNEEALDTIRTARWHGQSVYAETCTHYFMFTSDDLIRPGFEGAKWVCSPPFRTTSDQEALWRAVTSGDLQVVSTDHCPFWFEGGKDDRPGGKELGHGDFSQIPNGCPGIEDRLMVLYTIGVRTGRLSLNRWVELCCTNPARLFGLYPQKGLIAPGSDADIVVWDPHARHTISAATHHQRIDYNLYEGMNITGKPSMVILRGKVLVHDEQWCGEPGAGRFLHRASLGSLSM